MEETTQGLFGEVTDSAASRRAFTDASAKWAARFAAAYPYAYRWHTRCNRHLADLLRFAGSVDAVDRLFALYLADRWLGYDGHRLSALWRDRDKFHARAVKAERVARDRGHARETPGDRGAAII